MRVIKVVKWPGGLFWYCCFDRRAVLSLFAPKRWTTNVTCVYQLDPTSSQQLEVYLGADFARLFDPVDSEIFAVEFGAASDGDVRAAKQHYDVLGEESKSCYSIWGLLESLQALGSMVPAVS